MNLVERISSNPSSFKSRFSRRFLRALMKIRRRARSPTTSSSSSATEIFQRYRKVKIAADKSLASAVGSRRAWSRALLWKIQHQASRRHHVNRFSVNNNNNNNNIHANMIRKRHLAEKKKEMKKQQQRNEEEGCGGGFCHANELRKLVPGGESMDLCSLLDETAHYLKCLVAQVQVMRSIDEFYTV